MKNVTPEEWVVELGQRVRKLRVLANISQQQMADQAGVSLNVVKRLEDGHGSTVLSMLRILCVLEKIDWVDNLKPEVPTDIFEKSHFLHKNKYKRANNHRLKR
ncbi:MAG: helix-turn-helix transcriptional regulator [bacterium]